MKACTDKVWFITGTSTGIGRAVTERVLSAGGKVIATARKRLAISDYERDYPDQVAVAELDVTRTDTIESAVKAGLDKFGRIDVVMNNAGYGIGGAVEETSDAEARQLFDVNVFGVLNVLRAALPTLRKQGEGLIINVSSVVGQSAFAGVGIYSATKFAVEGLSEALAKEVASAGLKLMLVEPGGFDTEFASSMGMAEDLMDAYAELHAEMAKGFDLMGDPSRGAEAIFQAACAPKPPLRLALGDDSVEGIREKWECVRADLTKWEDVSRSTKKADVSDIEDLVPKS